MEEKKKAQVEATDQELSQVDMPETTRKKIELIPGKKYRGSFWINDYGVIEVSTAQEGTNPNGNKLVTQDEGYSIYETKNRVRIVLSFPKTQHAELIRRMHVVIGAVMFQLNKYKFL